jgi:hypothetical protein
MALEMKLGSELNTRVSLYKITGLVLKLIRPNNKIFGLISK